MEKQNLIALGLLIMLVCSALSVTAGITGPTVRLPAGPVRMKAINGATSWFEMYLFDVPSGFDITNGTYHGWCVQLHTNMTRNVNHSVLLYSSYDPNMPSNFTHTNWDKVNYLINHDGQGNRESIQRVIWYYICGSAYPRNDIQARAMINDTNVSGPGFVPQPGQKIAILVDVQNGNTSIQRTFLELTLPPAGELGDLVWNDYNANGIQDAGEPGIPGVVVQLYNASNMLVNTTTTDIHGYYSFLHLGSGNYSIQFVLPQEFNKFSPQYQGTDDTKDSDTNSTGRTPMIVVNQSTNDTSWDAGMYLYSEEGGGPVPPPSGPTNLAPSADGTAGEPYKGLVGEEIRFDGSRSYDHDGTIVLWHWSFGDGTTANGSIVTHAYTAAGSYTVALTVTDNDGATDTFTTIATIRVPNRPPLQPHLSGPMEGHQNLSYSYSVTTTDPDNDDVQYMIGWGDGSQDATSFYRSGHSVQLTHQWNTYGFYLVNVSAQDPSNATSDMSQVRISIDVRYVGNLGYLINVDGVGPYDMFYSNLTGNKTAVKLQNGDEYLIDTNGDGSFDELFNSQSGALQAYPETLGTVYIMLLVGVVVVILLIVLISFIMKRKK